MSGIMKVRHMVWIAAFLLSIGCGAEAQSVVPPLHTSGYQIVDQNDRPVQLLSVNWYGFDEKEFVVGGLDHVPLKTIVQEIRQMGFNSVRLLWANEGLERDPLVPDYALSANPELKGKHSMAIMDIVIQALTEQHIMVILDNHMSDADWCCKRDDNGLWYNDRYPETKWIADWQTIVRRYAGNPWVIGADLRNELRPLATWGGSNPKLDWHAAAKRGGDAVLAVNPNLLIFVEGLRASMVFTPMAKLPLVLQVPNRLIYSPHAYLANFKYKSYEDLEKSVDQRFGFLLHATPAVPVWVGEFGACKKVYCAEPSGQWVQWWLRYCREHHLANLSYWALNGTQSTGIGRVYGKTTSMGLLDTTWEHVEAPEMLKLIHAVQP